MRAARAAVTGETVPENGTGAVDVEEAAERAGAGLGCGAESVAVRITALVGPACVVSVGETAGTVGEGRTAGTRLEGDGAADDPPRPVADGAVGAGEWAGAVTDTDDTDDAEARDPVGPDPAGAGLVAVQAQVASTAATAIRHRLARTSTA